MRAAREVDVVGTGAVVVMVPRSHHGGPHARPVVRRTRPIVRRRAPLRQQRRGDELWTSLPRTPRLDDAPGIAREARAEGAHDMNTVSVALSADHFPFEATRS